VQDNEELQARLEIEEFSVIDNVMFVFLQREHRMHSWAQYVRDQLIN
jgi:hypothetical protein